jgi:hypothetical protein
MTSSEMQSTFALKPAPPVVRPVFVVLLVVFGACAGLAIAASLLPRDVAQAPWWGVGALAGAAVALALGVRGARAIQAPPVVVTATELLLPSGPRARVQTRVPLTEITSIEERARKKDGKQRVLVVGTRTGFHALSAAVFADPDASTRVRAAR